MAITSTEVVTPPAPRADTRWFRGDVDGLRAIAIVLVVAYHAGIPVFRGGFIGVDVFFVISGFLISRNLLRESETSGGVALGRFWARRVRRLVPALALVVAVTLVAGYFILPVFQLNDFAKQGAAATLYVSNILFASQATNYFAADINTSPFLHTWSLGVEEQFYLVWPVLFALVCSVLARGAGRRRRAAPDRRVRRHLRGLDGPEPRPDRQRQHVGVLRPPVPGVGVRRRRPAGRGAGPGPHAQRRLPHRRRGGRPGPARRGPDVDRRQHALPGPVGAAARRGHGAADRGRRDLGRRGRRPARSSAVLSLPPMQWLGRVSYSWYLWHWPAIVLVAVALDRDTVALKSATALVTLPIAWLAYRFFETPVRFSPFIARSSARTFLVGAAITVAVVVLAGAVWPGSTTKPISATTVAVSDLEARPGSSMQDRVNFGVQLYRDRVNHTCPRDSVKTKDGDAYCIGGDVNSDNTVMLLGDSHAGQWRRTLDAVARERHIKLLVREHDGCPAYDVDTTAKKETGSSKVCRIQHDGDLRVIDALQPRAVVISGWSGYEDQLLDSDGNAPSDNAGREQLWHDAAASLLGDLRSKNIRIGVILDEPTLPSDVSQCLTKKGTAEACAVPLDAAMKKSTGLLAAERKAIDETGGVSTIDMADVVCDAKQCNVEIDGTIVYVDTHHFTDAFAARQLPLVDQLVEQITQ